MLFFHEGTIIKSKESFFNNSKANKINSQKETITKGEEQPNCLFLYTYDFFNRQKYFDQNISWSNAMEIPSEESIFCKRGHSNFITLLLQPAKISIHGLHLFTKLPLHCLSGAF